MKKSYQMMISVEFSCEKQDIRKMVKKLEQEFDKVSKEFSIDVEPDVYSSQTGNEVDW